jgi:hypothetical protein
VSREQVGFVAACTILILVILGGIFSDWYGVQSDQRPVPKPGRPPHPICVYEPPGSC